jgi:hypothetical protein
MFKKIKDFLIRNAVTFAEAETKLHEWFEVNARKGLQHVISKMEISKYVDIKQTNTSGIFYDVKVIVKLPDEKSGKIKNVTENNLIEAARLSKIKDLIFLASNCIYYIILTTKYSK